MSSLEQLLSIRLTSVRYEFDTYKKYSLSFYTVLMGYADELQAVSVDEALIDVTSAVRAREIGPEEAESEFTDGEPRLRKPRNAAAEIAQKIRDDVRKLTDGCEGKYIPVSENMYITRPQNGVTADLHSQYQSVSPTTSFSPNSPPELQSPLEYTT